MGSSSSAVYSLPGFASMCQICQSFQIDFKLCGTEISSKKELQPAQNELHLCCTFQPLKFYNSKLYLQSKCQQIFLRTLRSCLQSSVRSQSDFCPVPDQTFQILRLRLRIWIYINIVATCSNLFIFGCIIIYSI
jgi:hypothetical protein